MSGKVNDFSCISVATRDQVTANSLVVCSWVLSCLVLSCLAQSVPSCHVQADKRRNVFLYQMLSECGTTKYKKDVTAFE